jgi:hypothetical protein
MIIELTWPEMMLATHVGRYGAASNGMNSYEKNILGAQSEMVVAKMLNVYWSGTIGSITMPDMNGRTGGKVQVRSTPRNDGALILHPDDKDEEPFYLVRATPPMFDVVGWIIARDGKLQEFWRTDRPYPAFFVPAELLQAITP